MKTIRRRRKEKKTDYLVRLKLLKSGNNRLIFRKTNKYIISQYTESLEAQDKILIGLSSKKLVGYGWPENLKGSLKSLPASYLTGYLMAKTIIEKKLETPIVDFGMNRTIHKSKLFAFLKGVNDGGLEIPCPEEAYPSEERINKVKVNEDFTKILSLIKSNIDKK